MQDNIPTGTKSWNINVLNGISAHEGDSAEFHGLINYDRRLLQQKRPSLPVFTDRNGLYSLQLQR
jgi:hypothetical protein